MKKNWKNNSALSMVLAIFLTLPGISCTPREDHIGHAETYTCPMHPTVISDQPGTCPVCGMNLVRKARVGEELQVTDAVVPLLDAPNRSVLSSIRTITGEFKSLPVTIRAEGIVTFDPRYVYSISSRIGGRLESVMLRYAYQKVHKGQRVAEIYSPELLTAQRELLFLVQEDGDAIELMEASKQKLRLLGATQAQIDGIIKRGQSDYLFALYSPYEGYVIREDQQAPALPRRSMSPRGGMANPDKGAAERDAMATGAGDSWPQIAPRTGTYVAPGQTLFSIVDATAVRIELDLPLSNAGSIHVGDEVLLDLGNEIPGKAIVDFVQPFFTAGESFVKVRVYQRGKDDLKIGQLVAAKILSGTVEALWLPKQAILDVGMNKLVFVKQLDLFQPKKIETGAEVDGWVEIRRGIASTDSVAANAHYLVDSESFVKGME